MDIFEKIYKEEEKTGSKKQQEEIVPGFEIAEKDGRLFVANPDLSKIDSVFENNAGFGEQDETHKFYSQIKNKGYVDGVNAVRLLGARISVLKESIKLFETADIPTNIFDQYFEAMNGELTCVYKTEILLLSGQISVTEKQIATMYEMIKKSNQNSNQFQAIIRMYNYCLKSGKLEHGDDVKYITSKKQLSGAKYCKETTAQNKIDEIFEAAQNAIK